MSSSISASLFAQAKIVMKESVEKGLELLQQAMEQAQQANDFKLEFDIILFLSRTYRVQEETFPCLENLNKGFRILNRNFPQDHIRLSLIYKEYGLSLIHI